MKRSAILVVAVLALAGPMVGFSSAAEETRPLPPVGENVKSMLDASIGRTVTLHLASGQEIAGTVAKVGDHVVHLSRLAGRDFYDAVVLLERVDAVLFKVVGK